MPRFVYLYFQGSIKIYKHPLPKDLDDHTVMGFDPQFGFFQVSPRCLGTLAQKSIIAYAGYVHYWLSNIRL